MITAVPASAFTVIVGLVGKYVRNRHLFYEPNDESFPGLMDLAALVHRKQGTGETCTLHVLASCARSASAGPHYACVDVYLSRPPSTRGWFPLFVSPIPWVLSSPKQLALEFLFFGLRARSATTRAMSVNDTLQHVAVPVSKGCSFGRESNHH